MNYILDKDDNNVRPCHAHYVQAFLPTEIPLRVSLCGWLGFGLLKQKTNFYLTIWLGNIGDHHIVP